MKEKVTGTEEEKPEEMDTSEKKETAGSDELKTEEVAAKEEKGKEGEMSDEEKSKPVTPSQELKKDDDDIVVVKDEGEERKVGAVRGTKITVHEGGKFVVYSTHCVLLLDECRKLKYCTNRALK
jgi:hypothetical protein